MKFASLLFDKGFFEERNFFRDAVLLRDTWDQGELGCG